MKVRFLADANFNQKIVAGLLLREPAIDFALPQAMIPEKMKDPDILDLAHLAKRVVVSHDVRTMPRWFDQCVERRRCAGLILVPDKLPIRDVSRGPPGHSLTMLERIATACGVALKLHAEKKPNFDREAALV